MGSWGHGVMGSWGHWVMGVMLDAGGWKSFQLPSVLTDGAEGLTPQWASAKNFGTKAQLLVVC